MNHVQLAPPSNTVVVAEAWN